MHECTSMLSFGKVKSIHMQIYRSDQTFSEIIFLGNIYRGKLCIFKVSEYIPNRVPKKPLTKCDSHWARSCENVFYAICKQQKHRSACTSAQSDQHLCCSLP